MIKDDQKTELILRCKEVAALVGEGREVFAECSYCHSAVPLWEALFTQQVAGVIAHQACPEDALFRVVGEAAPVPEFGYEAFAQRIEERMQSDRPTQAAGEIDLPAGSPPDPDPRP
jgi:hypothetical protein